MNAIEREAAGAPEPARARILDWGVPALLMAIVLLAYGTTVAPTVAFWDAGEFIATSYILGIPHPPATPLYVLIGRLFCIFPFGEPALRVNYLSLLPSAGALLFLFLSIVRVARRWTSGMSETTARLVTQGGAFIGTLVAAFTSTYWTDSTEAEVYSLSIFIWSFSTWLAIRWADSPNRDADRRPLLLVAYLLSLSIGIHLGTYLALPPFLIFLFVVDRKVLFDLKLIALIIVFTLVGTTVHAFIPIRSALNPAINEAMPTTWTSFMDCILRKQYKPMSPFIRQASWDFQFGMFWRYFREQFLGPPGGGGIDALRNLVTTLLPLFGFAGMLYHWKKNKETFTLFASQFLIGGLFLIFYMNFTDHEVRERDYFYGPAFFFFSVWIGLGFSWLFERLAGGEGSRSLPARALGAVAILCALLFPGMLFWEHFHIHDKRGDRIAQNYAYNMLAPLERDALLFTNGDNDTFPLWYLQEVEGFRKDVRILNLSLLNTPWYIWQLKHLEPKVPISFSDAEIEALRPIQREGKVYLVKDLASLDIIRSNAYQRPVYFAVTVADVMGFDKRKQNVLEGLVWRVMKDPQNDLVNIEKTEENLTRVFKYEGILGKDGQLDNAIYRDENATKLISNYSAAWARIAFERRVRGDKDGAIEALQHAGKISPDYKPYLMAMGALLTEAGRLDDARAFYEQSMAKARTDPDFYEASLGLGQLYERMNRNDSAEFYYRKALLHSPLDQDPYLSIYQMYTRSGELERAAGILREWLQRNPGDSRTRERLADLERRIAGGRDSQPVR